MGWSGPTLKHARERHDDGGRAGHQQGDLVLGEGLKLLGELVERMRSQVKPDDFLFEGELLAVRPVVGGRKRNVDRAFDGAPLRAPELKQVLLPL